MKKKTLAVLLPTYNSAQYLTESINSILNQTFKGFDLYILDDCSLDNTKIIVDGFNDDRIKYIKNDYNLGISETLNKGLFLIKEQYQFIARMDADDWAFSDRFEKQLNYLKQNKDVLMCGTQGYWTSDLNNLPDFNWQYENSYEAIKISLLFSASFGHSSIVFNSDIFKGNLKYNTKVDTCEDWDLWTKIVLKGEIVNLPYFLMKYRVHQLSNHRDKSKQKIHFEERSRIIASYWSQFGFDLESKTIYKFYYSTKKLNAEQFKMDLKVIVNLFNELSQNHFKALSKKEKLHFQYRFSRFILSFWKRANPKSRKSIKVWLLLLFNIKFSNKYLVLKNMYR